MVLDSRPDEVNRAYSPTIHMADVFTLSPDKIPDVRNPVAIAVPSHTPVPIVPKVCNELLIIPDSYL